MLSLHILLVFRKKEAAWPIEAGTILNFDSTWNLDPAMAHLISAVAWVRRGVAAEHPSKYAVDEQELERVSALARVELEDARVELERVSELAKTMGQGIEEEDEEEGGEE